MYCTSCGKQIAENSAFCQYCGKPVPQGIAFAKLVAAARTGDQDAIGALYKKTYSQVYYTVRSMIRDEDAVFDIVQDTYLKAFAHLDAFEGDAKFLPWVQQIAANTARNWLKRKRPMLFAEMASDDGQDMPMEELLPDERSENLPDRVIDQKETKRLIHEILEELPEDQRAVIGMFYFEEMSVKQIAAAMGVSESAVKSRLMYARGKIEKKVRELEKKGTKLYNLAPLPFLLLLFRSLKTGAAEAPNAQILQAVLASQPVGTAAAAGAASGAAQGAAGAGAGGAAAGTGASGAAGTDAAGTGAAGGTGASAAGTAAGTGATGAAASGAAGTAARAGGAAAAAGGLGALKLGIAALAAAAVIGLGVFGAVQLASLSDAPSEPPAREDVFDRNESERPKRHEEAETPEKQDEREDRETPEDPDAPEELAPIDAAWEQYRIILEQRDGDYGAMEPTRYRYALVQLRPEDPVPTLLLEVEVFNSIGYVFFYQYDPGTKTVSSLNDMVEVLTAEDRDGYLGSLAMAGDGEGMLYTEWNSGTGAATITRISPDGNLFNRDVCWTGWIDQIPDSFTFIDIEWHEVTDLA